MDNQRVNRTTALAVLLATAAFQLNAADTKRETMDRRVRAAIAGFQGTVRLYAKNLDTGETYGIGENEKVRAASTIKVPIMVAVFREVAAGRACVQVFPFQVQVSFRTTPLLF